MLFGVLLTMAWCLFLSPPGHALRQRASPSYNLGQCSSKHSCTSSNGWGVCKLGDSNAKRRVPGLHASRSPVAVADAPTQEIWWKEHDDVWQEVTGKEEFWQAVNEATEEVVLVDWYATWCKGCKRMLPELSKLASAFKGKVKFVKVNTEVNKSLAKAQQVKALPMVGLYRPNYGRLLSFQAVPSRMKVIKANIEKVVANPTKFFKLDPNGYALPVDTDPTPELQEQQREAEKLKSSTGGLFEHLMATANGKCALSNAFALLDRRAPVTGRAATGPASTSSILTGNGSANSSAAGFKSVPLSQAERKAAFLAQWGKKYGYGGRIDELYRNEIGCRLPDNQHYLDYTGSALYCRTPLQAAFNDLQEHTFGNPHSQNPSSSLTSQRIEDARDMILDFFNAPPGDYQVVFTKGATGALKIVGETFPWSDGSVFRYTRENHNSVLGIREYSLQHKARFQAVEEEWVEDWISGHKEGDILVHPRNGSKTDPTYSLFALPAEENFSGRLYPLRQIREIQGMSTAEHKWKILLDAAAFVPTQPLDLSVFPADFVTISFYKMLGFPTGLGALIMRTENVDVMRKTFWGGGTVSLASSATDFHVLKCRPSDKFEDGTVAFLDIISLQHGFDFLRKTLGDVTAVHDHVHSLTRHAYERLAALKHTNGAPMLTIFGAHDHQEPEAVQGGIINFEVLDCDGELVSYRTVEKEAADAGFHIRAGILCNPGAAYKDVGVTEEEVATLAEDKEGCEDEIDFISVQRPDSKAMAPRDGIVTDADIIPLLKSGCTELGHPAEVALKWVKKPLGSVRVSLGYMSTWEDVDAFVGFMEAVFKDRRCTSEG